MCIIVVQYHIKINKKKINKSNIEKQKNDNGSYFMAQFIINYNNAMNTKCKSTTDMFTTNKKQYQIFFNIKNK